MKSWDTDQPATWRDYLGFACAIVAAAVVLFATCRDARADTTVVNGLSLSPTYTDLTVSDDATIGDDLTCNGDLTVGGTATFNGGATCGNASSDSCLFTGYINCTGNVCEIRDTGNTYGIDITPGADHTTFTPTAGDYTRFGDAATCSLATDNDDVCVADDLQVVGDFTAGTASVTGQSYHAGNVVLGDAAADTVTVNATPSFLTNLIVTAAKTINDGTNDLISWIAGNTTFNADNADIDLTVKGDAPGESAAYDAGDGTLAVTQVAASETVRSAFVASNPTAADAGIDQFSGAFVACGTGWKSTATAGSQSTCWRMYNKPFAGTTFPGNRFALEYKTGAGAWTEWTNYYTDTTGTYGFVTGKFTGTTLASGSGGISLSSANTNITAASTTGGVVLTTGSHAGVTGFNNRDFVIGAGGAADAVVQVCDKIDGSDCKSGVRAETDGSGGAQNFVNPSVGISGAFGVAWASFEAAGDLPALTGLADFDCLKVYNTDTSTMRHVCRGGSAWHMSPEWSAVTP